jgi:hypothetical protein
MVFLFFLQDGGGRRPVCQLGHEGPGSGRPHRTGEKFTKT